jgi:hypothetical protein
MKKCIKERIIKMDGWRNQSDTYLHNLLPETEQGCDGFIVACLQEVLHVAQVHHQAPGHALHLKQIRTFKFMSISVLVGESVHL